MITRWHILGVALGVCCLSMMPRRALDAAPGIAHGPLLSDCDGALQHLVVHYTEATDPICGPVYRGFLKHLENDVTVTVVCPQQHDYAAFRRRVGPLRCRLQPRCVGHPITCWSRDRWLAFESVDGGPTVLLAPVKEHGQEAWPQRRGDACVAFDLAADSDRITDRRSDLAFDGGDFVADRGTVFVTPAVLRRNRIESPTARRTLRRELAALLRRPVVLMTDSPNHHAGMFMMPVGNRTVLIGDPIAAAPLVHPQGPAAETIARAGGLLDPATAAEQFAAAVRECRDAGYRVERTPTALAADQRTYLSYLNVIIDQRHGRRIVYLPVYQGQDRLNAAATAAWTRLGYTVRPVDCTTAFAHFGTLRCLVNVLARR